MVKRTGSDVFPDEFPVLFHQAQISPRSQIQILQLINLESVSLQSLYLLCHCMALALYRTWSGCHRSYMYYVVKCNRGALISAELSEQHGTHYMAVISRAS